MLNLFQLIFILNYFFFSVPEIKILKIVDKIVLKNKVVLCEIIY